MTSVDDADKKVRFDGMVVAHTTLTQTLASVLDTEIGFTDTYTEEPNREHAFEPI